MCLPGMGALEGRDLALSTAAHADWGRKTVIEGWNPCPQTAFVLVGYRTWSAHTCFMETQGKLILGRRRFFF